MGGKVKTRDFATKCIRFDKTSPVTGLFRLDLYPFLGKPMDASDDIAVKRLVILKASSCLGTVLGQIINSKRIAQEVGDQIMVCQTDDDAAKWTKTRGKEWLESIPDVMRLLKDDKYAQTNDLWLFRHKFLIITGPGLSAAQSDQVRYVQTDESHLPAYAPGRLVEFEKRMGSRWDRQSTHITTAADEGKEVDRFYYEASQDEWHARCVNPKCGKLFWMLWEEDAQKAYNGERVFLWDEQQSESATLDSIRVKCPHCDTIRLDNSRDRYALQRHGDYQTKNPEASKSLKSFRWSVFAAHWIPWRDMLAEYKAALNAWNMGDLKPFEDWEKKRLCKTWIARAPSIGAGNGSSDYKIGSVWITEHEKLRDCSFDVQSAPFHLWAQCDEWQRNGDSRRIDYQRITSWQSARAFQQHHGVADSDTYCDAGHEMHQVFGRCEEWGWYALFSDDADSFDHYIADPKGKHLPKLIVQRPYSMTNHEDAFAGKAGKRIVRYVDSRGVPILPPGYCLSRRWSKYVIGGYLMALKGGNSRYYGIASDINSEYPAQLNSYAYVRQQNKKSGVWEVILKQVRVDDHSFSTSSQCLLGAVIKKFFPLSESKPVEIAA